MLRTQVWFWWIFFLWWVWSVLPYLFWLVLVWTNWFGFILLDIKIATWACFLGPVVWDIVPNPSPWCNICFWCWGVIYVCSRSISPVFQISSIILCDFYWGIKAGDIERYQWPMIVDSCYFSIVGDVCVYMFCFLWFWLSEIINF